MTLNHLCEMPDNKSTPIGCIGSGFIMADCHIPAYLDGGLNPVAIASRTPANAQSVAERHGLLAFDNYREMLDTAEIEVVDIAVPPDVQLSVIDEVIKRKDKIRGILAQKPLGVNYQQAKEIVNKCESAGIILSVNQNMRFDHSVRACKDLLQQELIGDPVLATIDMRAIPHWMPWQQRQGWVTLRIMSIHHLDTLRYWLGDPIRVFCSTREDPRTAESFEHHDGICLYILEFENGVRASAWDDVWAGPSNEGSAADIGINWRIEGTTGMARGTIGWPKYPERTPSTLDYTNTQLGDVWIKPRWDEVWFPDAFVGTMAQLLVALESNTEPEISAHDNLKTMALVEACYISSQEHRAVELAELLC